MIDNSSACLPEFAEIVQDVPKAGWEHWLNRDVRYHEEAQVKKLLGDTGKLVVLDIGCGSARYAHCLEYKWYYGVDVWLYALEFARSWAIDADLHNYTIGQGGVFSLWPVKGPDIVLTLNVFRHFSDPLDGYERVWADLPDGAVWVTDFLTHPNNDFEIRGISNLMPELTMEEFLKDKEHTTPHTWFHEIGDWRLARITK